MKLLLFLFLSLKAQATLNSKFEFLLSTTSLPLSAVTNSADAKKELFGELYSPMGIKYNFEPYSLMLTTSKISLLTNKDKDKGLSTYITQLEGSYSFSSSSLVMWETQAGIMIYEMKGSGGQTVLNNGNSTSTFTLPDQTKNSQTFYIGIGPKFIFSSLTLDIDLNFMSVLSSTRRSYFLSVTLGVPL